RAWGKVKRCAVSGEISSEQWVSFIPSIQAPDSLMLMPLLVLAAIAVFAIMTYNALARLRLLTANAWADIDVQLKRRHDLIPSLVAAVKGHAGYEKGTLESVVQARNRAIQAAGPAAAGEAERALAGSVRQIFALAESYPELRAAESYLSLQKNLTEIEDQIQG